MKKKGLKRVTSYTTITLEGHLIEQDIFKKCLDALVLYDSKFRVMEWEIREKKDDLSQVTLQIFNKDQSKLNECLDKIFEIVDEHDAELTHDQSGPRPDMSLLRHDSY
jgi:hypothetical protein